MNVARTPSRICTVSECGRKHFGLGYCFGHYRRFKLYGDPKFGVRAFRGSGLEWIEKHKNHDGDACLPWPFGCKNGYGQVTLGGTPMRASRAMCIAAHGEPPSGKPDAAHSCGNSICTNPKHIRWASPAENTADKWAHGTMLVGEQCNGAKLQDQDVTEIRRLAGRITQRELGQRFGIAQSTISNVVNRKTWGHV